MELDNRLKSVYELLPRACVFIDIGTDHCYLPIYALRQGKVDRAYASDLRKGPLQNGIKNAEAYHLSDRITPLLSDGLDALTDDMCRDIDTFVFAGMGGMLIGDIIDRAPFLKDKEKTLVLQPMTAIYELKDHLYAEGFTIEKEVLSREGNKLYLSFVARFCGDSKENVNPFLSLKSDALFCEYLAAQKKRFLKQKNGLIQGNKTESERFYEVCRRLKQIGEAE